MQNFVIPVQVIFRQRHLFVNSNISLRSENVSIEDGWGMNIDEMGYGPTFSISHEANRVTNNDRVNHQIQRFNKQ